MTRRRRAAGRAAPASEEDASGAVGPSGDDPASEDGDGGAGDRGSDPEEEAEAPVDDDEEHGGTSVDVEEEHATSVDEDGEPGTSMDGDGDHGDDDGASRTRDAVATVRRPDRAASRRQRRRRRRRLARAARFGPRRPLRRRVHQSATTTPRPGPADDPANEALAGTAVPDAETDGTPATDVDVSDEHGDAADGDAADEEAADEEAADEAEVGVDGASTDGSGDVDDPAPAPTVERPAIEDFFAPRPAQQPAPTLASRLGRPAIVLLSLSVAAAGLAVVVALGGFDSARDLVSPPAPDRTEDPPPGGWQPAVLLATTAGGDGATSSLRGLAVLASDRSTDSATILLVPTSTVTDVPGFGSFTLEEAWDFGGSSLISVTIDNLLGLRIDGVLTLDADAWAAWFEPMDGATVDIPSRVAPDGDGSAGVQAFEPGSRRLTPQRVADYLIVRGEGETELQGLPRAQRVIEALSAGIAEAPEVLDDIVETSRTLPGTATPERIRTVLGEVAVADAEDAATTVTLPVIPLGSGADEVYRADEERVQALMQDRFAASRDPEVSGERLAVQILNGNAQPGVGQDVADALADGRYRIVLTGNADRFTYRETRILVYTEDAEDLAAAQDIQARLGVGTIERAGTPQSVVDVTIIVGTDFPPE